MNLDFVKTPFTNNPSMVRLEGDAYNIYPSQDYLQQKKKELLLHKESLSGESELSKNKDLKNKVINYIEAENNISLEDLTLSIEEDFVVMYKGNMELVSVCFPSGWIPVKKLGTNLSSIHSPVADNEQLIKSSEKLSEYMCKQSVKQTCKMLKKIATCTKLAKAFASYFNNGRLDARHAKPKWCHS